MFVNQDKPYIVGKRQAMYRWKEKCVSCIQKQTYANYAMNIDEVDGEN